VSTVISIRDLGKLYRLGQVSTGTLSHDLNRWWHRVRGKDDPYLRIGEVNDRTTNSTSPYVWALREIDLDVRQGEILGIIGRNGAGKSTLLKILSRVTGPTTGHVRIRGRVASLLEVGTGFHPELTGRENVFLNGTILGMSRAEVGTKLDRIVEFAGVARYLDTPVKRYSTGMMVRLGFAVAAHLEPDILIVDEVLAVGDAEFQKKAIGKMREVHQTEGRTVIFVSHNLGAVRSMCTRGVLIHAGRIVSEGDVGDVLTAYAQSQANGDAAGGGYAGTMYDQVRLLSCRLNGVDPSSQAIHLQPREGLTFEVRGEAASGIPYRIALGISRDGARVLTMHDECSPRELPGEFRSVFVLPGHLMRPGIYLVGLGANSSQGGWLWNEHVFSFEVVEVFDELMARENHGLINVQSWVSSRRDAI
jgi:lipopolysaccharide transport system ATP-binding protein